MTILHSLERALATIAETEHAAALVGGLAVSARAEPRFTRDADLVVAVDSDADAEQLVRDLLTAGYRLQALLEQSGVDRLSGARLLDRDEVEIDLLTASSGIEREIVDESERLEIVSGIVVPTARVGHLIALKLLSVAPERETDAADLRSLARVADEREWRRAADAVALIEGRGFHRGRTLSADLEVWRSSAR